MKSIPEKAAKKVKTKSITFKNTHSYYFHPDEDFKEDYEWEKNKSISEFNHSSKIPEKPVT